MRRAICVLAALCAASGCSLDFDVLMSGETDGGSDASVDTGMRDGDVGPPPCMAPTPPTATVVLPVQLAAGARHTCARTSDGRVYCWGDNRAGQAGVVGAETVVRTPEEVDGLTDVTDLAAGGDHTCAIVAGGQVRCWGGNRFGELGNGSTGTVLPVPVAVARSGGAGPLVNAERLGLGLWHSCAALLGGEVWCWGQDVSGELGTGMPSDRSLNPVASEAFADGTIDGGDGATCSIESGVLSCWGFGYAGALGRGDEVSSATPAAVRDEGGAVITGVSRVSVGGAYPEGDHESMHAAHVCAIAGNTLLCWGWNQGGQLGIGDNEGMVENQSRPRLVGVVNPVEVAAGARHTCALDEAGEVKCWGDPRAGQLGDGALAGALEVWPPGTPILDGVTTITAGHAHTCAIDTNDRILCWGDYAYSDDGGFCPEATPTVVSTSE